MIVVLVNWKDQNKFDARSFGYSPKYISELKNSVREKYFEGNLFERFTNCKSFLQIISPKRFWIAFCSCTYTK